MVHPSLFSIHCTKKHHTCQTDRSITRTHAQGCGNHHQAQENIHGRNTSHRIGRGRMKKGGREKTTLPTREHKPRERTEGCGKEQGGQLGPSYTSELTRVRRSTTSGTVETRALELGSLGVTCTLEGGDAMPECERRVAELSTSVAPTQSSLPYNHHCS